MAISFCISVVLEPFCTKSPFSYVRHPELTLFYFVYFFLLVLHVRLLSKQLQSSANLCKHCSLVWESSHTCDIVSNSFHPPLTMDRSLPKTSFHHIFVVFSFSFRPSHFKTHRPSYLDSVLVGICTSRPYRCRRSKIYCSCQFFFYR